MAVLNMTPSYLYQGVTSAGYTDEDGNKHPGRTEYVRYLKCDIVPSGPSTERDFGDGVLQSYSYTIYVFDRRCRNFAIGEKVKFEKDGRLSGEFLVKGFHRYQHQCKIWV